MEEETLFILTPPKAAREEEENCEALLILTGEIKSKSDPIFRCLQTVTIDVFGGIIAVQYGGNEKWIFHHLYFLIVGCGGI